MKIIIIGGVAGGATAAARMRRLSEENEIIIFEKGEYISFANCGLPYYIGGTIPQREKLLLQTPESLRQHYNLDTRIFTEVLSIDRDKKEVLVKDARTGQTYTETYDKLLLSPGAEPIRPPLPGIESQKIFTLRNIADVDKIFHKTMGSQQFVVVGGGFIGLEIAENLIERGKQVQLVELGNQVMAPVDYDIASFVHNKAKEKGLELFLKIGVQAFEDTETGIRVFLNDGTFLQADAVVLAIGVRPETNLAKQAGLQIGETGAIWVNSFMQTSDEHIYAVGDAIEVEHFVHGKKVVIPLAWPANRQGRLVADNITKGNVSAYNGSLGSSILKFFELSVASTGLNEKLLKRSNLAYNTIVITKGHHAGYYPGAKDIVLKVLFSDDGKILGAQAVGESGVDKRMDIIATAMKANMEVQALQDIEITYAPPYNSAKDLVNIVGYAAENILNGDLRTINFDELEHYIETTGAILIDVRTPQEFAKGQIRGAININVDDMREQWATLDKSQKYVVYCQVGMRGYLAYSILRNHGFDVVNLNGGYFLWNAIHQQNSILEMA